MKREAVEEAVERVVLNVPHVLEAMGEAEAARKWRAMFIEDRKDEK